MTAPLCVDLDGTLIRTDLLWEALFTALKARPLAIFRAFARLPRGKAAFKLALASEVAPDVDSLPFNDALLARLKQERAGRPAPGAGDRKPKVVGGAGRREARPVR